MITSSPLLPLLENDTQFRANDTGPSKDSKIGRTQFPLFENVSMFYEDVYLQCNEVSPANLAQELLFSVHF